MIFKKIADNRQSDSLSTKLRRKRFSLFLSLLSKLKYPIMILDVGGTETYWNSMGIDKVNGIHITILNTAFCQPQDTKFTYIVGDARKLGFTNKAFDVVFSNSVIEHVGGKEDQNMMGQEIMRVGKHYFIQTPNRNFILEPHFLFPFFQFLPIGWRIWLVMHFNLGWFEKQTSYAQAREEVNGISLLKRSEFLALFPGCYLYEEKIFGIVKSFIAFSGWD